MCSVDRSQKPLLRLHCFKGPSDNCTLAVKNCLADFLHEGPL